jgi:AraC-like DNA-binding protein
VVEVAAKTYSASYRLLEGNLLHGTRRVPRAARSLEAYAFGPQWGLHFSDLSACGVRIRDGGELTSLAGKGALFLPSFTLQQVELPQGELSFESLASTVPLPEGCPRVPTLFRWEGEKIPQSFDEVVRFLRETPVLGTYVIDRYAPATVRRAKREIDDSFMEDLAISKLASQVGMAHATMTRAFRRIYAMSPVSYRNKLRVMYSFWLLLTKHYSVAEAGYEVGFHNKSEFYRQFKREQKSVPSDFRFT